MLIVVGVIASLVISAIVSGYTIAILWGWFIVPTFHMAQLTLTQALGLGIFAGYIAHTPSNTKDEELGTILLRPFVRSLLCLFVGFIVTLFM